MHKMDKTILRCWLERLNISPLSSLKLSNDIFVTNDKIGSISDRFITLTLFSSRALRVCSNVSETRCPNVADDDDDDDDDDEEEEEEEEEEEGDSDVVVNVDGTDVHM